MSQTEDELASALEPERLDPQFLDIAEDRRQELLRVFPGYQANATTALGIAAPLGVMPSTLASRFD